VSNDDHINPVKPEEIIKEIFGDDSSPLKKFQDAYSKEALEFSEAFSEAYKKYLSLDSGIKDDKQKAYTAGFVYSILNNLLVSIKLLATGNFIPSGNLMRQAIESIAVAILCSEKNKIKIYGNKNKIKEIYYYKKFMANNSLTQSSKSISQLELNRESLGINKEALETLKNSRKFYHQYSHPSKLSLGAILSFTKQGDIYMGSCFDEGKRDVYKKELSHRIQFCKILPNLIENLENRLKET